MKTEQWLDISTEDAQPLIVQAETDYGNLATGVREALLTDPAIGERALYVSGTECLFPVSDVEGGRASFLTHVELKRSPVIKGTRIGRLFVDVNFREPGGNHHLMVRPAGGSVMVPRYLKGFTTSHVPEQNLPSAAAYGVRRVLQNYLI